MLTSGTLERDLARRVPALLSRARALLRLPGGPADRLAPAELGRAVAAIEALHQGLVGERLLARAETYDEAAHLGAYLLWWWPQSYAKVRAALSLAPAGSAGGGAVAARAVRLLDLGAGPGPGALALLDHLAAGGVRAEATLLDRSAAALAEARALAGGSLQTAEADLGRGPAALAALGGQRFGLICAAHLLSELPAGVEGRAALLRAAAGLLTPGGLLLVVEPALRETGRALLEVRDRLLAPGPGQGAPLAALGPCFTQKPCPALAHPRDWCTAEQPWEPPAYLRALSRELGLHAEAPLQFAPLLLGAQAPAPAPDVWRVVGVPRAEKGKKRLFVCNDSGRLAAIRLDRDRAPANAAFDGLGRGDAVRLAGLAEKGDGLRLGAGASVEELA